MIYNGIDYDSKAAVVRAMFLAGELDNSPEQKNRVALLLGMTVQTVHATLVKMNGKSSPSPVVPKVIVPAPVVPKVDALVNVKALIENRYNECYEIAKTKGYDLPKINIEWDLKGRVAGMFCVLFMRKFFRVNLELAKNNLEDYLKQVVPHEFSHYIVNAAAAKNIYGYGRPKTHGWEWKNTMVKVFGLDPLRCHSYDTSQVAGRHARPYIYKCNCREHSITRVVHNRMLNGQRRRCNFCKSLISFVRMA